MVYMAGHTYASAFQIGPKGRVVIPVATRRAANLAEGDEVVAIALGEGRVLIQTVDAVRQRVWRAAPTAAPNPTKDVRQMRLEDNAVADVASARRRATGSAEEGRARDEALLAELGL